MMSVTTDRLRRVPRLSSLGLGFATITAVLCLGTVSSPPIIAAQAQTVPEGRQDFSGTVQNAQELAEEVERLRGLIEGAEGARRQVLEIRRARTLDQEIDSVQALGDELLRLRSSGNGAPSWSAAVPELLEGVASDVVDAFSELRQRTGLPSAEDDAAQRIAQNAELRGDVERQSVLLGAMVNTLGLADSLGVDLVASRAGFETDLQEWAETLSALLQLAVETTETLERQARALPTDGELAARRTAAIERTDLVSDALRGVTARMSDLGLEAEVFQAQLAEVSGQLTADALDVTVVAGVIRDVWGETTSWLSENGANVAVSVFLLLVILFVAFRLARFVERILSRAMNSRAVQLPELLERTIVSTTRGTIIVLGLLLGLSQLGISLGPLLAGFGIAGFVIGFALQDTLGNFASGLMILLYQPFDVGDVVEAGGVTGTVSHMSLVNTTVLTFDNQTLIVPNSKIWQDVIKNVTRQSSRRVDLTFGIAYDDDIAEAERILREIVADNDRILDDPEPVIRLHELADSSVNFIVRPWVQKEDYWSVYWDVTRQVKVRFDEEGISIPFPQRDVHVYHEGSPSSDSEPVEEAVGSPAGA
jgi:small conductance mechanosensitive channel